MKTPFNRFIPIVLIICSCIQSTALLAMKRSATSQENHPISKRRKTKSPVANNITTITPPPQSIPSIVAVTPNILAPMTVNLDNKGSIRIQSVQQQPQQQPNTAPINTWKPRGLVNSLGCSCYINAILQCLCNLEKIAPLIKQTPNNLPAMQKQLLQTLKSIKTQTQGDKPFDPRNFATNVDTTFFQKTNQQQDAQEFFLSILNDQNSNNTQPNTFQQLFQILMHHQITCSHSKKTEPKAPQQDPYNHLPLSITPPKQGQPRSFVHDFIQDFLAESLTPDDYRCSECYDEKNKKITCTKCQQNPTIFTQHCSERRYFISQAQQTPPPIIVLQLKRFNYTNNGSKLLTPVSIDTKITLSFNVIDQQNITVTKNYSLKSIILHQGEQLRSGHYTALVQRDGTWFLCNDANVTPIKCPIKDLQQTAQQQVGLKTVSYLLFYELSDDNSPNTYIEESIQATVSTTNTPSIINSTSTTTSSQTPPQVIPLYNATDLQKAQHGIKNLAGANLNDAKLVDTNSIKNNRCEIM